MMSIVSTVSTAWGLIDVANTSHACHTLNSQNENGGSSKSEISKFLCYPRNFFEDRTTGGLLKVEEAASCLSPYRKARPKNGNGIADMVPADGSAMLNEMKDIRESLRSFIMDNFLSDMHQMARLS